MSEIAPRSRLAEFIDVFDVGLQRFRFIAAKLCMADNPLQLGSELLVAMLGKAATIRFQGVVGF